MANTKNMPHSKWLDLRKEGIGGSDASAIAGANKYASPIMVYMDKLGLYIPEKPEFVQFAARMGNEMEPIVRKIFVEKINEERAGDGLRPLKVVHRKALFAHDEHDWMRTNLDGIVYDPDMGKGVFEAKTASFHVREEWEGEDVPNAYFIQVQHNMAVMDMDFAYLAVLIAGNDYRHYFIPRDQEFIDYLISIEQHFWNNHILQRIPPAMSGHAAEKQMMVDQYPISEPDESQLHQLPIECIGRIERLDVLKQLIQELDQEKTAEENEIKAIMGTTEMAFAGSHKVTWKTASNGTRSMRIKVQASEDRNKFYAAKIKEIDKQRKIYEKERVLIEKNAEKERKAAEKERKAAEKLAKDALKAEKAALKAEIAAEVKRKENAKVEVLV